MFLLDWFNTHSLSLQAINTEVWPGESPLVTEIDLWEDCRMEV